METTLKLLQDLQVRALAKGIHSFHLNTIIDPDDGTIIISASVFRKGDDSDGDYLSVSFSNGTFAPELSVARLEKFIETA